MIRLDRAQHVRQFLQTYCKQSKYPWTNKPLDYTTEKGLPWVWEEIIKPLYSTYRDDGETRQYNLALIWVPKKQCKTTLLAGLSLYHLLSEPGSECYCIASDVSQASILFNQAADFVELSPELSNRLKTRRNLKTIEDRKHKSVFRVLSSTPEGKSGFNASTVFYDELAEWNQTHARDIWDRLRPAGMARKNPLQAVISTANYADPSHLGYEQFLHAQKILSGEIQDPTTLAVVHSLGANEDWKDPNNWWRVNPSAGITVPKQFYYDEFERAKNSKSEEKKFRTFYLCQWISGSADQWIDLVEWDKCREAFSEKDLEGETCHVGIDMARRGDLAAYAMVFPRNGRYYVIVRSFIPADQAARKEKIDRVPYRLWEQGGHVHLTDGDVIDPQFIRDCLLEDSKRYRFGSIHYDPYSFEESRQLLEQAGLDLTEATQTAAIMSPPTAKLEKAILEKKIAHNGNPVLTWCLNNCNASIDNQERVQIIKRRSTGRVDCVTATILGLIGVMAEERWAQSGFSVSF